MYPRLPVGFCQITNHLKPWERQISNSEQDEAYRRLITTVQNKGGKDNLLIPALSPAQRGILGVLTSEPGKIFCFEEMVYGMYGEAVAERMVQITREDEHLWAGQIDTISTVLNQLKRRASSIGVECNFYCQRRVGYMLTDLRINH
jgi:hypothetical protein